MPLPHHAPREGDGLGAMLPNLARGEAVEAPPDGVQLVAPGPVAFHRLPGAVVLIAVDLESDLRVMEPDVRDEFLAVDHDRAVALPALQTCVPEQRVRLHLGHRP